MYILEFTEIAKDGIARLKKSEPAAFNKLQKLLIELMEHPLTGTGCPERLTGDLSGKMSRHISQKHRLVYRIEEDIVTVYVLSAYGHYGDK